MMKRIVSMLIAAIMVLAAFPNMILASSDTITWTTSSDTGSAIINETDSIKGEASIFYAWGSTSAVMSADVSEQGAYSTEFWMLLSDLNSIRTFNMSGIDIFSVDKSGTLIINGKKIQQITVNQWYKVSIAVYPSVGQCNVKFGDVYLGFNSEAISNLTNISLSYSSMTDNGSATTISEPIISTIADLSQNMMAETQFIEFAYNSAIGNSGITRQWLYEDPTGRGKEKIYEHKNYNGEFRATSDPGVTSGLIEMTANVYVDKPVGSSTPDIKVHHSTPKRNNAWWVAYTINHADRTLKVHNDTRSVDLKYYEYGQWLTIKFFVDFSNDWFKVLVYAEDGEFLGGDGTNLAFDTLTSTNITLNFKDNTSGGYVGYIEGYGWRQVTTAATISGMYPVGSGYIDNDEDVYVSVTGNTIDPDSIENAVVKVDGIVSSDAKITLTGAQNFKIDVGTLVDGEHTVSISGLSDISGNEIAEGVTTFVTGNTDFVFGNLNIKEDSGIKSEVFVSEAPVDFTVYTVAYNADGSMSDYDFNSKTAGSINSLVTSGISSNYYDKTSAYLWDKDMNIITPGISTKVDSYGYNNPCDIVISKTYDPDIFTIKGTANGAAAIIMKDSNDNTIFIKEVNALANGYFETSFASSLIGDITLLINTQDGNGIKTIEQRIYTPEEIEDVLEQFNYKTNNPSYDATVEEQYQAMVKHFDDIIKEHYSLFGFNLTEYSSVSAEDVADILVEGTYDETSDVVNKYNEAMCIALFNAADGEDDISALVERYKAIGFDKVKTYSYFETVKEEAKKKLYSNMALENNYESIEDVLNTFEEQIVLSAIEAAVINSEIDGIISANSSYLEMDLSVYNTLSDTTAVTSAIKGVKYASIAEFKSDFSEKATAARKNEKNQNNNSSNGGGSGDSTPPVVSTPNPPVIGTVITQSAQNASKFNDLDSTPWAEESIVYLADRGVINGKGDKTFAPKDNITRAEFVKILVLAFEDENYQEKVIAFDDVKPGEWYEEYVLEAYSRGIINGQSDKIFGVNSNITREEMVVMLYRIAKERNIDLRKIKTVLFYDDANISEWAYEAVAVMSETEIVNGSGNSFFPNNPASRAEAAKLVYSLIQREAE